MTNIQNIIFDLGNVLLDLDYPLAEKRFKSLFGDDWNFRDGIAEANELFDAYQRGKIDEPTFFAALRADAPREVTAGQLLEAWNSVLGELPMRRLELLDAYRQRYRLYLLSNTNFTHMRRFDQLLQESHGITLDDFRKRFHGVYLSYELGMRKPDKAIYEYLLKDTGVRPEASLFIDDLEENITAAESVGIRGYRHDPRQEIGDILVEMLTIR